MIILLDGFDGLGKTSLAQAVGHAIDAAIFPTPSTTPLGGLLRGLQDNVPLNDAAMAHLYIADQLDTEAHLRQVALARRHVILDRHCMTSGPAYRPDSWGTLWQTLRLAHQFTRPDLAIVLEGWPALVRERLQLKQEPCAWSDPTIIAIAERLTGYTRRFAKKTVVLDASQAPDDLLQAVLREAATL